MTPEALHEIETRVRPDEEFLFEALRVAAGWTFAELQSNEQGYRRKVQKAGMEASTSDAAHLTLYRLARLGLHARSDIPVLVAEVRRLQEENKGLHDQLAAVVAKAPKKRGAGYCRKCGFECARNETHCDECAADA